MNKKIIISILAIIPLLIIGTLIYFLFFSFNSTTEVKLEKYDSNLNSNIGGKIVEINIRQGDKVKKGEIIARIDSKQYQKEFDIAIEKLINAQKKLKVSIKDIEKMNKAIKEAQEKFDNASKNLENANQDYIMYKTSFKDGTVTKKDLNNAIKNLETAKEQYNDAQEEFEEISEEYKKTLTNNNKQAELIEKNIQLVEQAKINLSNTSIIMPYDGTVESINIKINDTIKQNQSVVSIIPDACIIIAEFKNLKNIKKGKKAYIYTKDNKFKGKVVDSDKNKVFVSTSGEITKNTEIIKIKIKK